MARENKERMLLSIIALYNLARTCSRINKEYKDKAGKYKLDVYALWYGWKGTLFAIACYGYAAELPLK
jgi:hypothetical protein